MRRLIRIACISALLSACDPGVFSDLSDNAPTRVFDAPESFRGASFGARLASVSAPFGSPSVAASRVAAVGGAGSPFAIYGIWTDTAPTIELRDVGCKDPLACPPGT
ncbi:MAG: hypothetical protein H5U40_09335, partial [Polyangiaceae bacterium]|nr:hypothetical protein [Polyangiaceae bacterium]